MDSSMRPRNWRCLRAQHQLKHLLTNRDISMTAIGRKWSFASGSYRPRLCKNVFQCERYSKPDWKSHFYAKSTSADVPINFRFNVDVRTSILPKRFYKPWADSRREAVAIFLGDWRKARAADPDLFDPTHPSTSFATSPSKLPLSFCRQP